jgi:tetratricopeptide (TPR) repeat protein
VKLKRHLLLGLGLSLGLLALSRVAAAADDETEGAAAAAVETPLEREIRYASGLADMGFPDYAQAVGDQIAAKFPEAKAAVARIKVSALASQGKFKEAEALIAPLPPNAIETMSMRLAISDFYYSYGKLAEARKGYEMVLDAYTNTPPPEIRKFYAESAYKFAQMLASKGDHQAAIKALRAVLRAKPDSYTARTVEAEIAELLVKIAENATKPEEKQAALKEATKLCYDVMWTMDDLFGRSVVILAHAAKLSGETANARKLIAEKMPMLQQIEDALREQGGSLRDSPMSQC